MRVAVQVAKNDATLIRAVASALADPANAPEMRALLRARLRRAPRGLKMLLESAPLEGVPIARARERYRRVAL